MGIIFGRAATNLSAGYLNVGDADTALFHLQNIELDEKQWQRGIRTMMIPYYNNFAAAYIMKQDWEAANAGTAGAL